MMEAAVLGSLFGGFIGALVGSLIRLRGRHD
jgi:hypothetical protein